MAILCISLKMFDEKYLCADINEINGGFETFSINDGFETLKELEHIIETEWGSDECIKRSQNWNTDLLELVKQNRKE